jgi:hypothetical protein
MMWDRRPPFGNHDQWVGTAARRRPRPGAVYIAHSGPVSREVSLLASPHAPVPKHVAAGEQGAPHLPSLLGCQGEVRAVALWWAA